MVTSSSPKPSSVDVHRLPPFFEQNGLTPTTESEQKILSVVMRAGELSQPNVAKLTGLAQQSVSRLVKSFVDRGVLVSEKAASGRRGQPSQVVRLNPSFAYTFGIAMMTDSLSVVLMDFSGAVLEEVHCDMFSMTRQAVIPKLKEIFDEFISTHRLERKRIFGVGVGISGYCLGGHGRYNTPRALDDWALVDLEDILTDHLALPVWVENDANAAAVGESMVGYGRTYANFVYLYLAAGIGGGVIANRELLRGSHGNGGEIGMILPSHIYQPPTIELLKQILLQNGVKVEGISDLLARFDPNWPGVDEWISRSQEAFSLIISALAAILDTEAIVFGGRMPRALAEKVIPRIEIFDDARRAQPRQIPRLLISDSTDAGAIGAASLPFKEHFFSGGLGPQR